MFFLGRSNSSRSPGSANLSPFLFWGRVPPLKSASGKKQSKISGTSGTILTPLEDPTEQQLRPRPAVAEGQAAQAPGLPRPVSRAEQPVGVWTRKDTPRQRPIAPWRCEQIPHAGSVFRVIIIMSI